MPAGELVTVPLPVTVTVSVCGGSRLNIALTLSAPLITTAHAPVPVHAPDHPVNLYPTAAVAVRFTVVPCANVPVQLLVQEIPLGELVTVPLPLTFTVSVSSAVNVAVTLSAAVIVTLHVPVPEHAPLHPLNTYPLPAAAVRLTTVP